jgi:Kdo2-lipid IVA lauroyltransferase/acyltransferase
MFAPVLFYLFVYPITLLPFSVIYFLSDGLYYLIFYVIRYRRKVVFENLRNSFPQKSEREITRIAQGFYRHFCDLIVESFKMFSITEEKLREIFVFKDKEILEQLFNQNRNVILAGGHYNNWEVFAVACKLGISHKCLALYKPLKNAWFDKKMRESRGRFGLHMWPIKETKKMFEHEAANLTAAIFGMDQSPSNSTHCHWMKFLNQETGVTFGAERYARSNNSAVVYGRINKIKRGHYSFEAELVSESPNDEPMGAIIAKLTKLLEADIIKQPEYWLWSHKRWKRKRPEGQPMAA